MESTLLYHTACPRCRANGQDTRGNNLAVYSDGHQFCYSCKYVVRVNQVQRFKNKGYDLIMISFPPPYTKILAAYEADDPNKTLRVGQWFYNRFMKEQYALVDCRALD